MKDLLEAIKEDLRANLDYLKWVMVLDSELLPPEGVSFPGVGIRDGLQSFQSLPGQRDLEQLGALVVPYQSLNLGKPGVAVIGDQTFKGLAEIAMDIRARLNDNRFTATFGEKIHYAHVDSIGASETLGRDDDGMLIQMKRVSLTYRRMQ